MIALKYYIAVTNDPVGDFFFKMIHVWNNAFSSLAALFLVWDNVSDSDEVPWALIIL